MNRRHFLFAALSSSLPLVCPACGTYPRSRDFPSRGHGVEIPRFLFFPEYARSAVSSPQRVEALSIALNQRTRTATIQFTNNRELIFPSVDTFRTLLVRGNQRSAVLIKNLASWVLDSTCEALRPKLEYSHWTRLKTDFGRLQKQPVLDAVSLQSVFELLTDLDRTLPREIGWNGSRFSTSA